MNRHPPRPPHERLDAEERALAALLPRPHGRVEPGADLDARILAAARAATQPAKATPPRRRSWIAPTAFAASLMLAVGLAWQLRPPQPLRAPAAETASASADAGSDAMAVSAFEAPPAAASQAPDAQPHPMAAVPPPAELPVTAKIANAPVAAAAAKPEMAAAPAPPPPPPAPVVLESPPVAAPMPAPQATESERFAAPAMAKSARTGDAARERASASGNVAAQARDEAQRAADATTLDTVTVAEPEEPEEEVPPATADSPEVRDAWLRRIGELLKQGKTADAKASLDEFRRRYPDAAIPPELRKLEH